MAKFEGKECFDFPILSENQRPLNDVTRAACLFIAGRGEKAQSLTHGLYKSITGLGSQLVRNFEDTEQTEI
jgi:hypothetical protein